LETIVMEEVFQLLQSSEQGLSSEEAERRLGLFGPNKLEDKQQNPFLQVSSCTTVIKVQTSMRFS
jgi:H+-transporting ATPase